MWIYFRRAVFLATAVGAGIAFSGASHAVPIVDVESELMDFGTAPLMLDADFGQASLALRAGDYAAAESLIDNLKRSFPDAAGAWELEGALDIARGRFADAETALRKARELAPDVASIHTKLGAALMAQDKNAEASKMLSRALELNASDTAAATLLGRVELSEGHEADAIRHYQTAVANASELSAAHQELAEIYLRGDGADKVPALIEPVLDTVNTATPYLLLARAYIALERFDEARSALEAARERGLEASQVSLYEAVLARMTGDLSRSATLLRKLNDDYPDRPLLLQELATTLGAAGDAQGSREAAGRAAALLPPDHPARLGIADLLLAQGFAADALGVVEPIVNGDAPGARALLLAARAALAAGRLDAADTASQRLLADHGDLAAAYAYRTRVLLRQGQTAQAIEVAQSGTERLPNDPAVWTTRAGVLLGAGEPADAASVAREGLAQHPGDTLLKLQRATALQQVGDVAGSEALYRELVEVPSAATIALNNLANMVSADESRRTEALEFARRAHSMAPESAAVNDTLGWVLHLNGRNEEAIAALTRANAAAADDPGIACHLSIVTAAVNGVDTVREELERCAAQDANAEIAAMASSMLES